MPKKNRTNRKLRSWFDIAFIMIAVLTLTACKPDSDGFPHLEISGHEITGEEYNWAMYAARNEVLSDHAAKGISPVRWREETALGLPCEMVARQAVQILREYYAVVTLAQERGYLADGSFAGLKTQLEEENRQRTEAMNAGEIFTGLTAYDLEQYIGYRADALRRQFCDDASNSEMQITEAEILSRYEADKERVYAIEDSLELHYLAVDTWGMDDAALATLKTDVQDLRQQVLDGASMATAVSQMPHLQAYYGELVMDGGNYAMYARGYGDLLAFSEDLDTGEISPVMESEGGLYLILCVRREANGCQSLEAVRSVVLQTLRQERYAALIAERTEQITVSCDWDDLSRYTADKLG